jgi:hypothetical protein
MVLACSPAGAPPGYETFTEKLYRKCTAQPFVPIGCGVTVLFLSLGLKAFHDGQSVRSNYMMRARVAAQGVTVVFIMGYAWYDMQRVKVVESDEEKDARILAGEERRRT